MKILENPEKSQLSKALRLTKHLQNIYADGELNLEP